MRDVKLPSGATLGVDSAPFEVSKNLYQVLLFEMRALDISFGVELSNQLTKMFIYGLSSKAIDQAMVPCLKRCTYNGLKIDHDTFEPVEAREDWVKVLALVAEENIAPFMKSLFAEFKLAYSTIQSTQK